MTKYSYTTRFDICNAVFGSSIALMVYQHMKDGRGAPSDDDMDRFVEKAETITVQTDDAIKRKKQE